MDLRTFITPQSVAQTVRLLPVLTSQVMDLVYAQRVNHPFPVLGKAEILDDTSNIPVITRGSESYALGGGSQDYEYIHPLPVMPSMVVSPADLNNLRLAGNASIASWRTSAVDRLRRTVRKTTEALACQSLSGAINYALRAEGGSLIDYKVTFGSINSHDITTKWDSATLEQIILDLSAMIETIQDSSGFGGSVEILLGKLVFAALAGKIMALGNDSRVEAKVDQAGIALAGFALRRSTGGYKNLASQAFVPAVGDKEVLVVATDAPHRLYYCSLDTIEGNFAAMPFMVRAIQKEDPEGVKLVAQSKPMPVPVTKAICKGQALA